MKLFGASRRTRLREKAPAAPEPVHTARPAGRGRRKFCPCCGMTDKQIRKAAPPRCTLEWHRARLQKNATVMNAFVFNVKGHLKADHAQAAAEKEAKAKP